MKPSKIAVIGAGSWGTTLANLLAEKGAVSLWVYEQDLFLSMRRKRENEVFLPGIPLHENLEVTHSLEAAVGGGATLVCAVPSHAVRSVFTRGAGYLEQEVLIVSATKGLEEETRSPVSQVLRACAGAKSPEIVCLSGPSFAREVSRRVPTAVAAAGSNPQAAAFVQELFTRSYFRVYTNPDPVGVEWAGAMKNVMAIAAGVSDGLGFGHSSRAALIARGLAEMTRLGVRMGADARTFSGLAGLGDLVLTCTGDLSRNRTLGLELGRGRHLAEILQGMRMVAEGVRTAHALDELARELKVEMPITRKVYEILYESKNPREAVEELMSRDPRSERE